MAVCRGYSRLHDCVILFVTPKIWKGKHAPKNRRTDGQMDEDWDYFSKKTVKGCTEYVIMVHVYRRSVRRRYYYFLSNQTDGMKHGPKNRRTDGWMDGWMHGNTIKRDKLQGINPLCK